MWGTPSQGRAQIRSTMEHRSGTRPACPVYIDLTDDTGQAFRSMLAIIDGLTHGDWQICARPEQARVLVSHPGGDRPRRAAWEASGQPLVLVLPDSAPWMDASYVLRHPFRVMQLLALLDRVSTGLAGQSAPASNLDGPWAAADSVRKLALAGGSHGGHVAEGPGGASLHLVDSRLYADAGTLARLREGPWEQTPFAHAHSDIEPLANVLPLVDAAWYVGLHAPPQPAPWLAGSLWRLRRWPDLGRLGMLPGQPVLCALASLGGCNPESLATRSELPVEQVCRFMNAASVAGLLVPDGSAPIRRDANAGQGQRWVRLLGGLRRHLGWRA